VTASVRMVLRRRKRMCLSVPDDPVGGRPGGRDPVASVTTARPLRYAACAAAVALSASRACSRAGL
jgi:hypothetical protein